MTGLHPCLFDSAPWSTAFFKGQYTRGLIWVVTGVLCRVNRGRGPRICPVCVTRDGATYDLSWQRIVLCTIACNATCPWHGERRLVMLGTLGDWHTMTPRDSDLLQSIAFRLYAAA